MSETMEAPAVETTDAPEGNILTGIEFGSDQGKEASVEPGAIAAEKSAEQPAEQKPNETPAWLQRKIDRATFERREAERQRQAAMDEAAELRKALAAARGEEQEQPEQLTPDQIRQQERETITRQQEQRREVEAFGAATLSVAQSLTQTHGADAVKAATQSLVERAGLDFDNKSHQQIIHDISELPNSGAVYYALANDPDAASALLDAPERRQYAMLQKFAASVTEKPAEQAPATTPAPRPAPQISKAPAPVPAATGSARPSGGSQSLYDDNLSAEAFAKMFSKRG